MVYKPTNISRGPSCTPKWQFYWKRPWSAWWDSLGCGGQGFHSHGGTFQWMFSNGKYQSINGGWLGEPCDIGSLHLSPATVVFSTDTRSILELQPDICRGSKVQPKDFPQNTKPKIVIKNLGKMTSDYILYSMKIPPFIFHSLQRTVQHFLPILASIGGSWFTLLSCCDHPNLS